MQPYRTARPTAPAGAGYMLCQHPGCDEPAEAQYRRHATEQEHAALPEGLRPVDGVAHQAVFVCLDHEVPGFCDHTPPPPVAETACPTCAAAPGESCVKADGTRRSDHRARAETHTSPDTCTHAHRPDCQGQGACQCTDQDAPPARPKRLQAPPETLVPVGLTAPLSAAFAAWCTERGIDLGLLAGPVEPCVAQDNRPALRFTLHQRDDTGTGIARDWHGRLITETRLVPIDGP